MKKIEFVINKNKIAMYADASSDLTQVASSN